MSILINKNTRLLVQGITGKEGSFHALQMIRYGTNVVAGVTPGKGGEWVLDGKVPVFDTVKYAVEATGANASVIFVPARSAVDAIYEAGDSGIPLIVCITEGIPIHDMIRARQFLEQKGVSLIGPNSPGILSPGESKVGIIPGDAAVRGNVGIVSRSGTLTYEVLSIFQKNNIGISTCVGIGGDAILGIGFSDVLQMFEADAYTEQIVLIGEVGSREETVAAGYISKMMTKPVTAFIAGKSAPVGKRMGHAGAIINGDADRASNKIEALRAAGVHIADHPEGILQFLN
ncbi:MAG: succinate--CoA ligase subunit alpha [Anaerolineaceae bacterium]|nr:succinate--CoA ligase subunit alpha [Anaerolineaceae bacterium]